MNDYTGAQGEVRGGGLADFVRINNELGKLRAAKREADEMAEKWFVKYQEEKIKNEVLEQKVEDLRTLVVKEKVIISDDMVVNVKALVCQYFNVSFEEAIQESRLKEKRVWPRQCMHYLLNKYTKMSLRIIGEEVGEKDHATVLHSVKSVKNALETEPKGLISVCIKQVEARINEFIKNKEEAESSENEEQPVNDGSSVLGMAKEWSTEDEYAMETSL